MPITRSTRERQIFVELLLDVHKKYTPPEAQSCYCAFMSMIGQRATGEFMLIGRAMNGCHDAYKLPHTEIGDERARAKRLDTIVNFSNGTVRCPMLWVTDSWNDTDPKNYNTRKSSFWEVPRRVLESLGLASQTETDLSWPSLMVWSNLYKLSPACGRNPSAKLGLAQRPKCIELLREEIKTVRPKRMLLLTGLDWAEEFIGELGISSPDQTSAKPEVHAARLSFHDASPDCRVVIAPHPERKAREPMVNAIVEAFS